MMVSLAVSIQYTKVTDGQTDGRTTDTGKQQRSRFALIKSKCLPILLYGIEACPMNSADLQSLQFTMNKILFKIFGAMSKEMFREIINVLA